MSSIQNFIHKSEVAGAANPFVKPVIGALVVLLVMVAYDLRCFRNFYAPEAMDAAQLARNLADGKGYTTLFVRPFSMYLVQRRNLEKLGPPGVAQRTDYARIKDSPHPDIANPPVYPVILAGLMKALPFNYNIPSDNEKPLRFWSSKGRFARYQPDFIIALFNQVLFFALIALVFLWAWKLFDSSVAWTSAILLLGSELLWRFSISGLSTMLLLVIFMGLVWVLTWWESELHEPRRGLAWLLALAAVAGGLVGIGGLTRYAFAWLIVPLLVYFIVFAGNHRVMACLAAFAAFAVVLTPWMIRNYSVSGAPFGTATYTVFESTVAFPEYRLGRSLEPDLAHANGLTSLSVKLLANTRSMLQGDLLKLGGSWIGAFFLVGLLLTFRGSALRRLRYFALLCLAMLVFVQALGRTQLSEETPEINSENLLVLLAPLALVYGVSLFFVLLDQIQLPARELRYVIQGAFIAVVCLPMVFAMLPPAPNPVSYPPYYPPALQQTSNWIKENELMMSDVPWAVAWYGRRQCVWLTLNATTNPRDPSARENFFTIFDDYKPISALYLTPETMDSRFLSQWVRAGETSWGSFILDTLMRKQVPPTFPLHAMPEGFLPEQLFLSDWRRWRNPEENK